MPHNFQPGFRISALDGIILAVGAIASAVMWTQVWWAGFVIAFVVGHFFLFCNVVRLARPLELTWGGIFVALAASTIVFDRPTWPVTIAGSLAVTVTFIVLEMRKPSYHGALWKTLNPGLLQWWEQRHPDKTD